MAAPMLVLGASLTRLSRLRRETRLGGHCLLGRLRDRKARRHLWGSAPVGNNLQAAPQGEDPDVGSVIPPVTSGHRTVVPGCSGNERLVRPENYYGRDTGAPVAPDLMNCSLTVQTGFLQHERSRN